MRDDRYTRGQMPYEDVDQGYPQDGWDDGYGYAREAPQPDRGAGFNRHQPSNARRTAAENPIAGVAKRVGGAVGAAAGAVGGAVGGLFAGRSAKAAPSGRPSRSGSSRQAAVEEGGDYLGTGDPCRICGKPVAAGQARCPHCGAFARPLYQNVAFWVAVVVLVALVVVLSIAVNSCKSNEAGDGSSTVGVVTKQDRKALEEVVANAKGTIEAQQENRTYTRYSLNNLQYVLTAAEAVLSDETATDESIAAAVQEMNTALNELAPIASDAAAVAYADLSANVAAYTGQQVAVSGTVQEVGTGESGVVSMAVAVAGDTSQLLYVNFTSADVASVPEAGSECSATGTVIGEYNGCPVVYADAVSAA